MECYKNNENEVNEMAQDKFKEFNEKLFLFSLKQEYWHEQKISINDMF